MTADARLRRFFAAMAIAAAALTFVVIVASAFMRHTQAGLGCADWPACYARMAADVPDSTPSTGVRIARIAHRLAATSVLALVVGMLLVAWTQRPTWKREGTLALAAFVVAAALAVLGILTPGAKLPAVTLGNLGGGYLMLALFAALAATAIRAGDAATPWTASAAPLRWIALAVLAVAFAHAIVGGMIGAQYALPACPTLGKCEGFPFDDFRVTAAFDAFRPLIIADGRVVPPAGAAAPFVVHRATAIVVAVVVLVLAHALRRIDRRRALILAALALAAPLLGVAAIVNVPSLPLTVLHNAAAALLIAALAHVAARPGSG
ncbi:MAG: COX15/CtaA family protein [Betaproteobacteria bacterium]